MAALVLPASRLGRHAAASSHAPDAGPFLALHAEFDQVVGPSNSASLKLLASSEKAVGGNGVSLFHEAGVWAGSAQGSSGDVYITSNIVEDGDALEIKICRIRLDGDRSNSDGELRLSSNDAGVYVAPGVEYESLPALAEEVVMANGATAYGKDVLWCSQGQHSRFPKTLQEKLAAEGEERVPGSLMLVRYENGAWTTRRILNNYHGREFNALNDVAVHPQSGSIFFTDPDYGVKQGFKAPSQLPNGVWRLHLETGQLALVADGIAKPNGVVCSPDGKTCYVTDTDFIHGDGSTDPTRSSAIYAFDIVGDIPQLHNKRVFSLADCGAADGIKVDEAGNIFTGTFEGVNVYNPSGVLIGKILLPRDSDGQQRGCANLVFGAKGELIILSETSVWVAKIAAVGELKGVEQ